MDMNNVFDEFLKEGVVSGEKYGKLHKIFRYGKDHSTRVHAYKGKGDETTFIFDFSELIRVNEKEEMFVGLTKLCYRTMIKENLEKATIIPYLTTNSKEEKAIIFKYVSGFIKDKKLKWSKPYRMPYAITMINEKRWEGGENKTYEHLTDKTKPSNDPRYMY